MEESGFEGWVCTAFVSVGLQHGCICVHVCKAVFVSARVPVPEPVPVRAYGAQAVPQSG